MTTTNEPLLWHYTTLIHMPWIEADNWTLRPGVRDHPEMSDGRPALWFSANQISEATVRKDLSALRKGMGLLGFHELAEQVGIIRIGADRRRVHAYHFRSWERRAHPPNGTLALLTKAGIAWGANPEDWYFTFRPVPSSDWDAMELLVPIEAADLTRVPSGIPIIIGEKRRHYCYERIELTDMTEFLDAMRERARSKTEVAPEPGMDPAMPDPAPQPKAATAF
jgi:hypothetical protein